MEALEKAKDEIFDAGDYMRKTPDGWSPRMVADIRYAEGRLIRALTLIRKVQEHIS